ncbi:MAG: ABC transporter permease, partial [Actinomycetota bacterium]
TWIRTLLALLGTLLVMAAIIAALGASPLATGKAIITGALGNKFNLGQTIVVSSVLILTGLAAAIPFSARLWNVGGEGQMTIGAIVAAIVGIVIPGQWPALLVVPVVALAALIGGSLWAMIPGWLKARFDASEIVTSLMLNFITLYIADWVIFNGFPQGVQQTRSIISNARLPRPWQGWLVDIGVFIALAAAVVAFVAVARTRLGFSIRAIGANARASRLAGVRTSSVTVRAFLLAGAFAGLAGALIVQGRDGALLLNFSASFGYLGIGVALVARLHPLWVVPSALVFGILRVGSNSLQAAVGLSPSLGIAMVALFILLLMLGKVIRFKYPESSDAH